MREPVDDSFPQAPQACWAGSSLQGLPRHDRRCLFPALFHYPTLLAGTVGSLLLERSSCLLFHAVSADNRFISCFYLTSARFVSRSPSLGSSAFRSVTRAFFHFQPKYHRSLTRPELSAAHPRSNTHPTESVISTSKPLSFTIKSLLATTPV